MPYNSDMDDIIKKKMDELAVNPGPRSWSAIQSRLPVSPPFYKTKSFWGWGAASFLLGISMIYLFTNYKLEADIKITPRHATMADLARQDSTPKFSTLLDIARNANIQESFDKRIKDTEPQYVSNEPDNRIIHNQPINAASINHNPPSSYQYSHSTQVFNSDKLTPTLAHKQAETYKNINTSSINGNNLFASNDDSRIEYNNISANLQVNHNIHNNTAVYKADNTAILAVEHNNQPKVYSDRSALYISNEISSLPAIKHNNINFEYANNEPVINGKNKANKKRKTNLPPSLLVSKMRGISAYGFSEFSTNWISGTGADAGPVSTKSLGTAYGLGVTYDINERWALQTEITLNSKIHQEFNYPGIGENGGQVAANVLDYLQVPLLLKHKKTTTILGKRTPLNRNLIIGLKYGKLKSIHLNIDDPSIHAIDLLNKNELGIVLGYEYQIFLSRNYSFTLGTRGNISTVFNKGREMSMAHKPLNIALGIHAGLSYKFIK